MPRVRRQVSSRPTRRQVGAGRGRAAGPRPVRRSPRTAPVRRGRSAAGRTGAQMPSFLKKAIAKPRPVAKRTTPRRTAGSTTPRVRKPAAGRAVTVQRGINRALKGKGGNAVTIQRNINRALGKRTAGSVRRRVRKR